jgi:hypothetical protein
MVGTLQTSFLCWCFWHSYFLKARYFQILYFPSQGSIFESAKIWGDNRHDHEEMGTHLCDMQHAQDLHKTGNSRLTPLPRVKWGVKFVGPGRGTGCDAWVTWMRPREGKALGYSSVPGCRVWFRPLPCGVSLIYLDLKAVVFLFGRSHFQVVRRFQRKPLPVFAAPRALSLKANMAYLGPTWHIWGINF